MTAVQATVRTEGRERVREGGGWERGGCGAGEGWVGGGGEGGGGGGGGGGG